MKYIKYICFDLGNVIFEVNFDQFLQKIVDDENRYTVDFLRDHIDRFQPLHDLGTLSLSDFFEAFNLPWKERYLDYWNQAVQPNATMMQFLAELKEDSIKIAFLSNMGQNHFQHLTATYPEIFKDVYLHISCQVGATKPQKLFFQSFLMEHPEFKFALYLDDKEENIVVGNQMGFDGCKFALSEMNEEELKKRLQDILQYIKN